MHSCAVTEEIALILGEEGKLARNSHAIIHAKTEGANETLNRQLHSRGTPPPDF